MNIAVTSWRCVRYKMPGVKRCAKVLSGSLSATACHEAIRSDNGSPFASRQGLLGLSRLSVWWVVLGIDLERGRPGHPQDNAGHERMHKDISRELEAVGECAQDALDLWRQSFNYERPHEALGMRCPGE